ncbi:MAG TPA: response regulator, partial [Planctomycetota bacterium]|nr:response regulator [Planctomycetota bacterium]
AVCDDGPGVPTELQGRIFEPFFTTRPEDGRLGLGLSVAHATARTHGGTLVIESAGSGARFVLTLPHDPAAPRVPPALPADERSGERTLHLVVVDDEPMLREMLTSFGRRQGWRVECAADGESALRLLSESEDAPDCVLCDLRMPGLDGEQLLERVRALDPSLAERFLFQSGDVGSAEAAAVGQATGLPVLAKPLSFEHLREWIEAAAARRPAETAP